MCSGLACASKTRRRGTLNTRVNSISRSDLIVSVIAPIRRVTRAGLGLATTAFLLLLKLDEIRVQLAEPLGPDAHVALNPVRGLAERRRLEPARAPLRFAALAHEACVLEHLEVLRDGGELE